VTGLAEKHCRPREGGEPLTRDAAAALLPQVPGWELDESAHRLQRTFKFKNYYETIAFVNALAWIVHREDHHPDLEVGYNRCVMRFSTHAVKGLSENDFICAARINGLQGE
jgi:4a-hydroxytetrahydrobiopterin dehydratase